VGFCRRYGFGEVEDTAALLTSELVTNAVQHGTGPLTLSISRSRGELRVNVSDNSTEPPRLPETPASGQPNGRGLLLVEALASSWCYRPRPNGKTVSFTMTTSGGAPEPGPVRL
jgi:anti-sigma regulatory factor (Ser/Thr protein kinase)